MDKLNSKQDKQTSVNISTPSKRVAPISFGEIAVLTNAIVIIVAIYLWLLPIVEQQDFAGSRGQSFVEHIEKQIKLDFDLIENQINTLSKLLISNSQISSKEDYQSLMEHSEHKEYKERFDQVYWVKKLDGKYKIFPLFNAETNTVQKGYNFDLNKPDKALISNAIKEAHKNETGKLIANLNPAGTSMLTTKFNDSSSMLSQPFILTKQVADNDVVKGFLVILSRSNKAFTISDIHYYPSLSYLSITEVRNGTTLLAYTNQTDSITKLISKSNINEASLYKWGDRHFQYRIESYTHVGNQMLEVALYAFVIIGSIYATFLFSVVRTNRIKKVKALIDKEDLVRRAISLGHEAAENKELKTRVDDAEQKNIALLNSISDVVFECDGNGNIVFVNDAWARVTNLGTAACLEKRLFSLIDDDDIDHHKKEYLMLVRGHKDKYNFSSKLICAEGNVKEVDIVLTTINTNALGNDPRIVGTISDKEETNRAQKALMEVEARYKTIWERAAAGLFQLDTEGQYISANPSMYKLLGYKSLEEMQASINNANQQVYANYRERMKFLRALEQNDEIRNWETQVRRKDGTLIWVNENSRLVRDDNGKPVTIEGSIEDVTERVETSESIKEAKMQSDMANRAKSEFLANMSHELRTPLNSIIGFSEIIRDEVMGPIGQKAYWEYARDINKSGQRLLRIINEILDISRIETGERELNESIIDLRKLSDKCIDILGGKMRSADLSILVDIPKNTPNLLGEELAVKQILMNLLSNSIKFTPAKGKITISVEIEDKGSMRLSITDTGVGINEADIEKALSPFTQLDGDDMARKNTGTGLGLTLVNALIKMHNGRLELESQKGFGTTATLVFPLDRVLPKTIDDSDLDTSAKPSITQLNDEAANLTTEDERPSAAISEDSENS